ncbi:4-hydroxy-3-methylbut-2-enyl diphosphate reductase [Kribbella sp. NPDC004536]|uniref:4-hydroxy-3-methylbut-2-enyl diphosphate reductase n=1 Tax=Kribbella sp. NPDC004536 TaxID=3364106 RepID=UPI003696D56E
MTVSPQRAGTVLLAAPRGFCAGVERAVTIVQRALGIYGAPVYVRRHIVHNLKVVETLEELGAVFVEDVEDVPAGATLVFSAHGVSPAVRQRAARRGLRVVDATCPLVTKVHREAERLSEAGYEILLIGQPGHDETEGTLGVAPTLSRLVDPSKPAPELTVRDPSRVAWLSQTTLSFDETDATVSKLREQLPLIVDPPSDDICYAAQNRQNAVKAIATRSDVVLVVGSAHSHNSAMLARVARDHGAPDAHLIEGPEAIDPAWLIDAKVVGLTAGASAPATRISDTLAYLATHGYTDVHEIEVAHENQTFALPEELRRRTSPR